MNLSPVLKLRHYLFTVHVRGYILKGAGGQELTSGIYAVHNGGSFVSPGPLARLFAPKADEEDAESIETNEEFTARERDILQLVSRGLSNDEIGVTLSLSLKTIKNYMTGIMRKLKVHSRLEAASVMRHRP